MSREEVSTFVTAEDYQYYWKRVNERTASSYSILHFGHYTAAANSETLASLSAAKISEVARRRVRLARWGVGVTVLLYRLVQPWVTITVIIPTPSILLHCVWTFVCTFVQPKLKKKRLRFKKKYVWLDWDKLLILTLTQTLSLS